MPMRTIRVLGLVALLLGAAGCTLTDLETARGSDGHVVTATASCLGLCAPERAELFAAMHRCCAWPAVPAIQTRGSEANGLLGRPHAVWKFTCLTVPR